MDDHIEELAREAFSYSAEQRVEFLQRACASTEVYEAACERMAQLKDSEESTTRSSDTEETPSSPPNQRTSGRSSTEEPTSVPPTEPLAGSDWPTVPYRPEEDQEESNETSSVPPTQPLPDQESSPPDSASEQDTDEETKIGTGPSRETEQGEDLQIQDSSFGQATTQTQEKSSTGQPTHQSRKGSAADPASASGTDAASKRVGPWRLVEPLGRGGMGVVYRAERADGQFQQQAALKLIRHDLGPEDQKRFLSERQILAQFQHPNIAHLLDGGVTEDGRPYFAMEYVDGTPINTYCNEHELGVEERIRLFLQICEAVQFAHSNLVVHRDLKPSNILVAEPETQTGTAVSEETGTSGFMGSSGPQVKLLDFGIAKALEGAEGIDSYTQTGEGSPMTPPYAAPEQVEGASITTATDVYAMGMILCELLTGTLPYEVRGKSPVEAAQIISEAEPKRLGELVEENPETEVIAACGQSPEALKQRVQGDLEVIVQKALRKEPDRRYTSASNFGRDIERHMEGLPVEARPATTGYRLRRFVERNRTAVMSAAGAFVALLLGLGVAIWQAQVAASERDRAQELAEEAQQNAERAEAARTFLIDMIGRAAPATTGGEELTMREVLDEAEAELGSPAMQNQPRVRMDVRMTVAEMYGLLDRNEAAVEQNRKVYETGREVLGEGHPKTLKAAGAFGAALFENSKIERADSLFKAVVPKLESERASPESRSFVLTRYGDVLKELNQLSEAETMLRRGLDWHERAPDPDTLELTRTLKVLGDVYREQGRLDVKGADYNSKQRLQKAEEQLQRALRLSEDWKAPKQKLMREEVLNSLAILYNELGEMPQAEEMYRRSLNLAKILYGEESGTVARTLTNLTATLRSQDKLREADSLSVRTVELHKTLYGPSDHRTGFALFEHAEVLRAQDRYKEASAIMEEARALFMENFGQTHPYTASAQGTLLDIYRNMGEFDKALRHGTAALQAYRTRLDETDGQITRLQRWMGEIRIEQGQYERAEDLLNTALEAQKEAGDEREAEITRKRLEELYDAWSRSGKESRR